MPGYETNKRDKSRVLGAKWMQGGVPFTQPSLDSLVHKQEVMSYRTHGQEDPNLYENLDTRVTYNPFVENYPNLNPDGSLIDTGHEFYVLKREEKLSHMNIYSKRQSSGNWFRGPLALGFQGEQPAFPSYSPMSFNDMKYYGAKAIKLTTPTQPLANTAQMIAELVSEGLPLGGAGAISLFERFTKARLIKNGSNAAQWRGLNWRDYLSAIGGGTLAVKFGAEPLISDMVDVMSAVSAAGQRIEQWQRDSGRQIRRSISLPDEIENTSSTFAGSPFLSGLSFGGLGLLDTGASVVTKTTSRIKRTWFSGAYMYYATVGETALDNIIRYGRMADLILGTKTSFETLWELAPWSWLVDYFANVGDAISNATRFSADKLVLRYGYLMQETIAFNTYSAFGYTLSGYNPGTVYRQFSVIQRERRKATPFGFGIDPNGLTASQTAILAALGLSKGGRYIP